MSKPTFPCDANALAGSRTRELCAKIVRDYRERKRGANRTQSPATPIVIAGRDAVTPPLLDDRERGCGDSTNARMHKLIGKYRDFALVLDNDRE